MKIGLLKMTPLILALKSAWRILEMVIFTCIGRANAVFLK